MQIVLDLSLPEPCGYQTPPRKRCIASTPSDLKRYRNDGGNSSPRTVGVESRLAPPKLHWMVLVGDQELVSTDCIAKGGQGFIFPARTIGTTAPRVLKLIPLSTWVEKRVATYESAAAEAAVLKVLGSHPNVLTDCSFHGPVRLPEDCAALETIYPDPAERHGAVYAISMPRMAGDLCEWTGSFTLGMLVGICRAVAHAHSRNVAHHDIKMENVFVDADGAPVLADWGLARRYKDGERCHKFAGSPSYCAPEVYGLDYDPFAADMWSLGCVLLACATRIMPMPTDASRMYGRFWREIKARDQGASFIELLNDVYCDGRPNTALRCMHRGVAQIVDRLLHRDPSQRPTAAQLLTYIGAR